MVISSFLLAFVLAVAGARTICISKDDCYPELFEPDQSGEYKTIREGQRLPAGLTVRINLQTGLKEAKSENFNGMKSAPLAVMEQSQESTKAVPLVQPQESKRAVSSEIIVQLDRFISGSGTLAEQTSRFNFLEEESVDYDFAVILTNNGYFKRLVSMVLDESKSSLSKTRACIILGNSLQNNSELQAYAGTLNFITDLKAIIQLVNTTREEEFACRCFYMASCYFRGNMSILPEYDSMGFSDLMKSSFFLHKSVSVKVKIISLLQDILTECIDSAKSSISLFSLVELILSLNTSLSTFKMDINLIDICIQSYSKILYFFRLNDLDQNSYGEIETFATNIRKQLDGFEDSEFRQELKDQVKLVVKNVGVHLEL